MTVSEAEFIAIVRAAADLPDLAARKTRNAPFSARTVRTSRGVRDSSAGYLRVRLPLWANELREMLAALAEFEFGSQKASPLYKLCECGVRYGSQKLEATVSSELLAFLSQKAKHYLKSELGQTIAKASKPCFTLELDAFRLASEAIRFQPQAQSFKMMEQRFLGKKPCDRLFAIFKRFPVLAKLWSLLISQWRDQVVELLHRFSADQVALSRIFFGGQPIGRIIDLRAGLSDPHNKGRTVMLLQCEAGSIIYKPRCGRGEQEWSSFIRHLNARSFRPKLKAAKILCRDGYCWMEEIRFAPCKNHAAAQRFYERLGGIIAAAYLTKMADCHRDNFIAHGEYPVLVDAEAFCHMAQEMKNQASIHALYCTGFFPTSRKRLSWQYRSSALGKVAPGQHTPRIFCKPLAAEHYQPQIVRGFVKAWSCILGDNKRRADFVLRLRTLCGRKRRWIARQTRSYNAIRRASIQPAALRSGSKRQLVIAHLCKRSNVSRSTISKEISALKRLDIPYLVRKTGAPSVACPGAAPAGIVEAPRLALHF